MKREAPQTTGELPVEKDGFVNRWSRLKCQSKETPSESQLVAPQTDDGDPGKALTDDDMPDIESLTPNSDYSGFLSPEVSESLRRLALRKLFQSAEFNVRDGLDDYDQDFTSFAKLGDLITADMKHRLATELERAAERESAAESEGAKTADQEESEKRIVQEVESGSEPVSTESNKPEIVEPDELAVTKENVDQRENERGTE